MKPVQAWEIWFGGVTLLLVFPSVIFAAPRLYLNPATVSIESGSVTSINLTIDTSNQAVSAADAKITFPKALLESSTITAGTFFDSVSKVVSVPTGTIDIHGYFSSASSVQSRAGTGIVATLLLKGLAPGLANLAIPCTAGTTIDANIADSSGKDIIDCTVVTGAEIVLSQSTGGSSIKPTPTPSELPTAGGVLPTVAVVASGMVLFGSGCFLMRKSVI